MEYYSFIIAGKKILEVNYFNFEFI